MPLTGRSARAHVIGIDVHWGISIFLLQTYATFPGLYYWQTIPSHDVTFDAKIQPITRHQQVFYDPITPNSSPKSENQSTTCIFPKEDAGTNRLPFPSTGNQTSPTGTLHDVTEAVFAALHYNIDNEVTPPAVCKSPSRGQNGNHSRLRLPSIRTTPNVAANVMSEECDLGYSSFTDMSTLQEISDAISINCSNDSDDVFRDVSPSFDDIIDDVLDSITSIVPEPENKENTACDYFSHSEVPTKNPEAFCVTPPKDICYQQEQSYMYEQCYIPSYQHVPSQTYFVVPNPPVVEKGNDVIPYCSVCNRSFQTKSSLRVHMRSHRGERPHVCPHCDKCFTQKSTLRTHIRTHTGEKPYTCQFCSRGFGDYSTFRKHVRVHTGEKPYVCDVCKKGFTQSGNMLRHREVHFKKSSPNSNWHLAKSYTVGQWSYAKENASHNLNIYARRSRLYNLY